jgi:hypothetical protein
VSGGGGWGTKQGLLSLDPETTLNAEEHEDLESFIRSFKGEDAAGGGGIVTPGSYVQFFTEGIYPRAYDTKTFHPNGSAYAIGTASEGKKDSTARVEDRKEGWKVESGLFGAVSSEAIYVKSDHPELGGFKTKIDAPSSYMVTVPSLPITLKYYQEYMIVEEVQKRRGLEESQREGEEEGNKEK